jgi:hypothetical protein
MGHQQNLGVASGLVIPTPVAFLRFFALDHPRREFDLVATDRTEAPQHAGTGSNVNNRPYGAANDALERRGCDLALCIVAGRLFDSSATGVG